MARKLPVINHALIEDLAKEMARRSALSPDEQRLEDEQSAALDVDSEAVLDAAEQAARDARKRDAAARGMGTLPGARPEAPRPPCRHRDDPAEIDRQLAEDRRKRGARSPSRHAPPPPAPEPKRKPWSAAEAFSIVGEKERMSKRASPGEGKRRQEENEIREWAKLAKNRRRLNHEE